MLKKLLIITGAIIVVGGIYYGSYFIRNTTVKEEAPELMDKVGDDEFGNLVVTKRVGSFQEVDFVHKGSGEAILLESGVEKVLRFENFSVTNGPDLYVYLIKNDQPTNDEKSLGEYIDLGRLKGNRGDQNYTVTQVIDEYDTVVIWCKQFSRLFTYANIK